MLLVRVIKIKLYFSVDCSRAGAVAAYPVRGSRVSGYPVTRGSARTRIF